jgi:hypothetical protein
MHIAEPAHKLFTVSRKSATELGHGVQVIWACAVQPASMSEVHAQVLLRSVQSHPGLYKLKFSMALSRLSSSVMNSRALRILSLKCSALSASSSASTSMCSTPFAFLQHERTSAMKVGEVA